jgi:transcription antitermination factor NusG
MDDKQPDPRRLIVGQHIRIMAGVFEKFEATIDEIDGVTGKVRAGINIFGCITPVELEPTDCEPIDDPRP